MVKSNFFRGIGAILCAAVVGTVGLCGMKTVSAAAASGLDNLNNKPGNLYIAYLGGSITEGTGSTEMVYKDTGREGSGRWSSQLTKRYFERKYPNKTVKEINAGVGGTTSDLGLFRMQKDVIDKCGGEGPDVVFVDFTVNDVHTCVSRPLESQKTMEGIVRVLSRLPKKPVIIFCTFAAVRTDDNSGFTKYLTASEVHRELADYYGIGTLDLLGYVTGGIDLDGNPIVWESGSKDSWTGDGAHPNNRGYTAYTDFMIHEFETNYDTYFKLPDTKEQPMTGYEFGEPKAIPVSTEAATYTGQWKRYHDLLPERFEQGSIGTTDPSATVSFHFTGRSIGIYAARGNYGAQADYVIDQGSANPISGTISNYYPSGWMGVGTMIRWDLPYGEHTITIQPKMSEEDERNQFMFGYFFVDEQNPEEIASPVTQGDATVLLQHLKLGRELTDAQKKALDKNGDGALGLDDVIRIVKEL